LMLARTGKRLNSSFEGLTRRVATIGAALLVALLLAARLPVGENPLLLSAVPWFLGALGAAWFASPIDQPERLQGQVLMVAAAAAVILAAVPAGPAPLSRRSAPSGPRSRGFWPSARQHPACDGQRWGP